MLYSFGSSYDLEFKPENTTYYVNIYMKWLSTIPATRFHLLGHHSGASLATEIAATYSEKVLTLCVIGLALMSPSEQVYWNDKANIPFNKPAHDSSHLMKTWKYLESSGADDGGRDGLGVKDLEFKHREFLNHARAWDGRCKIYTCVFKVDLMSLFVQVKCPVLSICSRDDVLWDLQHHVKELVSHIMFFHVHYMHGADKGRVQKPEAESVEVGGGDFEPMTDTANVVRAYTSFLDKFDY